MTVDVNALHAHLRGEHADARAEGCPACGVLPEVSADPPRAPRKNSPTPATGRLCGCGCGEPVARRFKPGHDAKLKSRLLKAARAGSQAAKDELEEWGWGHFL